jgi:hypothetical protein
MSGFFGELEETVVEVGELIETESIAFWTRMGIIVHHLETKTQMSFTNREMIGMDFVISERPRMASARQVSDTEAGPAVG